MATQIYLAFDDTAWVRVQARAVLAGNFGLLPPVFTTWNLGGSIAHEEIPDLEAWDRLRGSAEVRDRARALYGRASDRAVKQALQLPKPMPYLTSQSIWCREQSKLWRVDSKVIARNGSAASIRSSLRGVRIFWQDWVSTALVHSHDRGERY